MKRIKYLGALLLIAIGWVLLAPHIAGYLIVERPLARADVLVVLSGSAVYKERTRKAAELYRQGAATIIFITNDGERSGWSQTEQTNPAYVDLERRELISNGVPQDAIITLPAIVSGTNDEARVIASEVEGRQIRSLLIVTSAYHTRRALTTFEKALTGSSVEVGIVHAEGDHISPDSNSWWLSMLGWQTVVGEYVKSVGYYFYY